MKSGDKVWHQVFERDKGICQYCGMDMLQDFEHYMIADLDHVQSRKNKGAEDNPANLVVACHGCNIRLSRAHQLTTVLERKAFLKSSSEGARKKFNEYKAKMKK